MLKVFLSEILSPFAVKQADGRAIIIENILQKINANEMVAIFVKNTKQYGILFGQERYIQNFFKHQR